MKRGMGRIRLRVRQQELETVNLIKSGTFQPDQLTDSLKRRNERDQEISRTEMDNLLAKGVERVEEENKEK